MCGIVAVVGLDGNLNERMVRLFEQLLYHDTIRGPHSTGVMGYHDDNFVRWDKEAVSGPEYLSGVGWNTWRDDFCLEKTKAKVACRALVGHNRWATVGTVNKENAHPFHVNKTILVHNGTLNKSDVPNKHDREVDSHALTAYIDAEGYQEALKDIWGAYAVMWFDLKDTTLRVARNAQRPLAMCEVHHAGTKYRIYCSEQKMLEWIMDRAKGLHVVQGSMKGIAPREIIQHNLTTRVLKDAVTTEPLPQPPRRGYSGSNYPASLGYYNGGVWTHQPRLLYTEKDLATKLEIQIYEDDIVYAIPLKWEGYSSNLNGKDGSPRGKVMCQLFSAGGFPIQPEGVVYSLTELQANAMIDETDWPVYKTRVNSYYLGDMTLKELHEPEKDVEYDIEKDCLLLPKAPETGKGKDKDKRANGKGKGKEKEDDKAPEDAVNVADEVNYNVCGWCGLWAKEEDLVNIESDFKICQSCVSDYMSCNNVPNVPNIH